MAPVLQLAIKRSRMLDTGSSQQAVYNFPLCYLEDHTLRNCKMEKLGSDVLSEKHTEYHHSHLKAV